MFKITALLCVLAVNGQNLCMTGNLPLTGELDSVEKCNNTVLAIGNAVNEEFMRRQIYISMKCEKIGEAVWWYMERLQSFGEIKPRFI